MDAYTNIATNADIDAWLPRDGRIVPDIPTFLQNNSIFNVKDYGAVGNYTADDTVPLVEALVAAGADTGSIVLLPPGAYRITSVVNVPANVKILGFGEVETIIVIGSSLCGSEYGAPIIQMGENSALSNLGIRTEGQVIINGVTTAPIMHPYAIGVHNASNILIENVRLISLWKGIGAGMLAGPNTSHECLTLRRVTGICWAEGIAIDQSTDVDRVEDCHIHPNYALYYDGSTHYTLAACLDYLRNTSHAVAFRVRKCDWIRFSNCFAYGYYNGLAIEAGTNTVSGTATAAFIGCGWDGSKYTVDISACTTVTLTGCTIASTQLTAGEDNKNLVISAGSGNVISVVNCDFFGAVPDVEVDVTGAASLTISDSHFFSHVVGVSATCGTLALSDNTFSQGGGTAADISVSGTAMLTGTGNRRADGSNCVISGAVASRVPGLFETAAVLMLGKSLQATAGINTATTTPLTMPNATSNYFATLPGVDAMYLVWACQTQATNSGPYSALALVHCGGTGLTAWQIVGSGIQIAVSGLQVGATNNAGGPIIMAFGYIKLNYQG